MGDHMHLNREKATLAFKKIVGEAGAVEISMEFAKVMSNSSRWEDRFGSLMISQTLVESGSEVDLVFLLDLFKKVFTDEESRVRN